MRKYGESKTTRIMMTTVPHVTSGSGLRKFQADGFLFDRLYALQIRVWGSGRHLVVYDRSTIKLVKHWPGIALQTTTICGTAHSDVSTCVYASITVSSTKYFVARQECKGTHCCVSMASLNGVILLTPIYWSTIQREEKKEPTDDTSKDVYSLLAQHVSGIIMPIVRRQTE